MKTTRWAGGLILATVLTTILTAPAQGADKPPSACPLLIAAEIGAATGETAGQPHESAIVISEGPAKGQTMGMCDWPTGSQSGVSLAVTRGLPGAQREAGLAQFEKTFQTLKSQGWSQERKDFNNGACVIFTPPASAKGMPISTGCFAEAKGMGISVGHNGPSKVSMDKMKTLLDKAIGRLP
jgi:hypothetical protein